MTELIKLFNGETETVQVDEATRPVFDFIGSEKQSFFEGAYWNRSLGQILYDLNLVPLARAIQERFFLNSFYELISSFQVIGTYENYLTVLHSIFGSDAVIEFTQNAPADLLITITVIDTSEIVDTFDIVGSDNSTVTGVDGDSVEYTVTGVNVLPAIENRELAQILRYCASAGIYIDFTIQEA